MKQMQWLRRGLCLVLVLVMVLGYVLMSGGGSDDPNVFNEEMFSFRRIVLAPIVIIIGMVVEIWAIMYVGKVKKENRNELD